MLDADRFVLSEKFLSEGRLFSFEGAFHPATDQ